MLGTVWMMFVFDRFLAGAALTVKKIYKWAEDCMNVDLTAAITRNQLLASAGVRGLPQCQLQQYAWLYCRDGRRCWVPCRSQQLKPHFKILWCMRAVFEGIVVTSYIALSAVIRCSALHNC